MNLNEWFDKGMSPEDYIATLDKHKDGFSYINKHFTLPQDDVSFFQSLKEQDLRVIVLAEPWCGHCMLDIPILFHLTKEVEMPTKLLLRDENLALMDQYLTNGRSRTIPIFIFIDKDGNEVAKWGPIADLTRTYVDQFKQTLPPEDAEDYQDKLKEVFQALSVEFEKNEKIWQGVYESMKQTLNAIRE